MKEARIAAANDIRSEVVRMVREFEAEHGAVVTDLRLRFVETTDFPGLERKSIPVCELDYRVPFGADEEAA